MSKEEEQLAELKTLLHHLQGNIQWWAEIDGESGGKAELQQTYALWASSLTAIIEYVDKASPDANPKTGVLLNELRVELINLANSIPTNKLLSHSDKQ